MRPESSLRSSVRRILALARPARRPRRRTCVLLAALAAWGWGNGTAGAAEPLFRQDLIPGFSSFDVGECGNPDFVDLDGDGDLDLVAGNYLGALHYFENIGSLAVPSFRERPGSANPFRLFTVPGIASPDLADLDGDGDRDLILGGDEGTLRYFENTGSATAPAFLERLVSSSPFFGIDVGDFSSPDLADLDGDGDLDAVVGDAVGQFSYFANTGSASAPAFATAAIPFTGLFVGDYGSPQLADVDVDGDFDLVAGAFVGGISYFRNTGSASAPAFVEQTGSANPFALVAAVPGHTFANLALADLDGNGLRDLVVGEDGGSFLYFRNTGSASAPAFVAAGPSGSPFGGADLDKFGTVAMADLDQDGDLDAITGQLTALRYFRNTGSPRRPAFLELTGSASPLAVGPLGAYLSPALGDLDDDGDFDAVVANYDGNLSYLVNTGSSSAPALVAAPSSANPFASLAISFGSNHPALADLDHDGDDDLLVGNTFVDYFENTGLPSAPAFVKRTGGANPFGAMFFTWGGSPHLVDYDGDGELDLVAGRQFGDFRYFRNTGPSFPAFSEQTGSANPFFALDIGSMSVPAIHDLDGDGDLDLLAAEFGGWLVYLAAFGGEIFVDGFECGETRNWSKAFP